MYKICLVGGEDVHKRIELSKYLIKAGFKVTILGTSKESFPKSIKYIKYPLKRSFSPYSDYITKRWYKNFFSKNSFDIIHTFDTKPNFLVPLALKKTKTPITRTITGLGKVFMDNSLFYKILRKVYFKLHKACKNRVQQTIFQNIDDKNLFVKHNLVENRKTSLILSSGIELSQYTQKVKRDEEKRFTIICVARLVYEKGIINFLEAARICKEKGYDFSFILVGALEENSKRLNETILKQYDDIVTRLGHRKNVNELLLDAHTFVLPTFREGFPRVLLEAAASGLPIISTNVTGVKGFLKNEYDALLIEAKNSKLLADAMIKLFQNKKLSEKLVKNAFKTVELYSLERVANQYITIFKAEIESANL